MMMAAGANDVESHNQRVRVCQEQAPTRVVEVSSVTEETGSPVQVRERYHSCPEERHFGTEMGAGVARGVGEGMANVLGRAIVEAAFRGLFR